MEIADHAFAVVAPTIEVGDTEESVAWRLELAMREAGAEAVAFETIIAAGPNAAKPHHHPTERRIAAGEPVVMDFGARYLGLQQRHDPQPSAWASPTRCSALFTTPC